MKTETQERIGKYLMKGWFVFVFIMTFLYFIYEPIATKVGTDYKKAWALGLAFGFTFAPVLSWASNSIIKLLIKIGLIKELDNNL